ncbi:MAG: MaoC/PaaZ C-terminal domain-containing protein [Mycobacteriales bacterium]
MTDSFIAGQELSEQRFIVTRADLVRYAGASGDFNPIHYSDRVATGAGLPGVIAHGMYTMALAARAVGVWVDNPAAVVEYGVRFTKPVIVPDDDSGVAVVVSGVVKAVDNDGMQLTLTVTSEGQKVLGQARAAVKISRA